MSFNQILFLLTLHHSTVVVLVIFTACGLVLQIGGLAKSEILEVVRDPRLVFILFAHGQHIEDAQTVTSVGDATDVSDGVRL